MKKDVSVVLKPIKGENDGVSMGTFELLPMGTSDSDVRTAHLRVDKKMLFLIFGNILKEKTL